MLKSIVTFILAAISGMGYLGIIILMTLESSFFPFPSEVVIPPAGYLASQGKMNVLIIILSGILGSIIGALINYYIAFFFGRNLLIKYGKYMFLPEEKLNKVEKYFNNHGEITTFIGRLIPVIRQYISFPAGLAKMNIFKFVFYTALGASIWVIILTYVGYFVGNNIELVKHNLHIITLILIPLLILLVILYIMFKKKMKNA